MTLHLWILIIAGALAGFINAVAGGGTILTFPALILLGENSIVANATSTLALIVGIVGGVYGYRRNIPSCREWLKAFTPWSLAGGLLGGILLTLTPTHVFDRMVPFLILFATLLFLFNRSIAKFLFAHESSHHEKIPLGACVFQFCIAIYGGYFGAGLGILMLATFSFIGLHDIRQMNTVKTVLGATVNVIAAAYFILVGLINWHHVWILAAGAVPGYYIGAIFTERVPAAIVRTSVGAIGLLLAVVLFIERWKIQF